MNFIKKNSQILILVILGVAFFFIYSYLPISQLNWQSQNSAENFDIKFNTPDEVINYYFSQQFSQTSELYYFEPLDNFMQRVIFPRWALEINGRITPGNFIGIDLIYGSLAKIFSNFIIPFLTPLLAVIGVLFFYLLLKEFFKKNIAFISSMLVFIFPGFWYYASRTMFHNILFLSLLIIGLYFLIRFLNSEKNKLIKAILTGLFFGLSLITRTSEIVWIFLIVLIILIFYFNHPRSALLRDPSFVRRGFRNALPYLFLSLIIFCACFLPVLYQNKILYNNYFSTGYNLNTMTENLEGGEVGKLNLVKAIFLPFGFHPRVILSVLYNYVLKLFWPWIILWLIGLILFFKEINHPRSALLHDPSFKRSGQKMYLILSLVVSCWLLVVYCSWFFQDSVIGLKSLGSSYIRYFLPACIFSLPMIGFLFVKIWKKTLVFKILILIVSCFLLIVSFHQVYFANVESLQPIKNQLIKYQIQSQHLLELTHEDDIILMDSGTDKILFPHRKHLIVPQNGVEWTEITKILNYKNVYYFHHKDVCDSCLNNSKFRIQGLKIINGIEINSGGKLFQIKLK